MNMSHFQTPEWREDRILRRAMQHNLFDHRCCRFLDLQDTDRKQIESRITLAGKPILVFFRDSATWTVVTTDEIATCHSEGVFQLPLDQVPRLIQLWPEFDDPSDAKHRANYLAVGYPILKLWAPEGAELMALWSILLMFIRK